MDSVTPQQTNLPETSLLVFPEVHPLKWGWVALCLIAVFASGLWFLYMPHFIRTLEPWKADFLYGYAAPPMDVILLFLLGATVFLVSICYITIIYCVIIYRAWKALQPLKILCPEKSEKLLNPGMASGFLFIPYFNIYWMFPAMLRLETFGRLYAQYRDRTYNGPSKCFVWLLIITFLMFILVSVLTNTIPAGAFIINNGTGLFASILEIAMYSLGASVVFFNFLIYVFIRKTNNMVASLGQRIVLIRAQDGTARLSRS